MTTPGFRPRKGFMAKFQAAMAPVAHEDDNSPIVRPRATNIAVVMAIVAGAVFLFVGGYSLVTQDAQVDAARTFYIQSVAECKTTMGGIGTNVPSAAPTPTAPNTPIAAKDLPSTCKQYTTDEPTADQISSFKSSLTLIGILFVVVGLAAIVAGWYLRTAAKWARRVVTGIAALALIGAALLGISNSLTLLATLLLVISLLMCYIGKGGLYFARMKLRRRNEQH